MNAGKVAIGVLLGLVFGFIFWIYSPLLYGHCRPAIEIGCHLYCGKKIFIGETRKYYNYNYNGASYTDCMDANK